MPASGSISGSQDAFYSANGTTTSASTNLVIQSAAVTMPDSLHYRFTIKVENLSTLVVSPTLGGTDAVWLVRREVPDAGSRPSGPRARLTLNVKAFGQGNR